MSRFVVLKIDHQTLAKNAEKLGTPESWSSPIDILFVGNDQNQAILTMKGAADAALETEAALKGKVYSRYIRSASSIQIYDKSPGWIKKANDLILEFVLQEQRPPPAPKN